MTVKAIDQVKDIIRGFLVKDIALPEFKSNIEATYMYVLCVMLT